ncbi:hypothetical protein BH09ACT3_BH09ACT3_11190 [soil metagenome]
MLAAALLALTPVGPAQAAGYGLSLAGFDGLAAAGHDGRGVVVAVVDSGIDLAHPAFSGRIVAGHDFVDGDDTPQDENGHGTHVSGIVAAALDSGAPGAAPGASIMPVRVLDASGAGSNETVAAGIRWSADHGATVINLSLGDSGRLDRIRKGGPIALALRAVSTRAVVVVAAGNDSQYEEVFRAGVPALVVVAVDSNGVSAPFSNVGDPRAVAAPGVDILSTAPLAPTTLFPAGSNGYAVLSGTSMAAPFVSAEAALLEQAGASPSQVADAVTASAVNPAGDPLLGAGGINAAAALDAVGATPSPLPSASASASLSASPSAAASDDAGLPWSLIVIGLAILLVVAVGVIVWLSVRRRP